MQRKGKKRILGLCGKRGDMLGLGEGKLSTLRDSKAGGWEGESGQQPTRVVLSLRERLAHMLQDGEISSEDLRHQIAQDCAIATDVAGERIRVLDLISTTEAISTSVDTGQTDVVLVVMPSAAGGSWPRCPLDVALDLLWQVTQLDYAPKSKTRTRNPGTNCTEFAFSCT
eukprot:1445387-Rhodomonas_salina.1